MRLINFINFLKRNISFVFLLSLFSFGLLFSMISSFMGFMGEDNLFSSMIRRLNFFLALLGILIAFSSNLYKRFLTKEVFFVLLLYIYYYFIVNNDLANIQSKSIILNAHEKNMILVRMSTLVFFPMLAALVFRFKNLNQFLLAKVTLVSILISLILALSVLDVSIGTAVDERLSIDGELNSLNMGYWGATLFVLTLFYITKENNKMHKFVLGFLGFVISLYVMLISGSRGPLIYSFIIFYYFMLSTSAFLKTRRIINVLLVLIVLLTFFDYTILTDAVGLYNPNLQERLISGIEKQDSSGRDMLYTVALNQFYSNPFFGDFFLLTSGHYKGEYPHNILLEALMSLGLFGALPFFYLIIQTFKRAHYLIKKNDNTTWIALMFLISFFKGMSTWSLYGNMQLWVSMVIILSYKLSYLKLNNKKKC